MAETVVLIVWVFAVVGWMAHTLIAALRPGGELDRRATSGLSEERDG